MGKISDSLEKTKDTKRCAFSRLTDTLDDDDMVSISNAIARGVSGYLVGKAIREGGYNMAGSTVGMHIREVCSCFKEKKK